MRRPSPSQISGAPDLSHAVSVFRCAQQSLWPSRPRLRAVPLTGSHPSATLNTIARASVLAQVALWGSQAWGPSPYGKHLVVPSPAEPPNDPWRRPSRHARHTLTSRTSSPARPAIQMHRRLRQPSTNSPHLCTPSANVTLAVVAPCQAAVLAPRGTTIIVPPAGTASHEARRWI